MNIDQIGQAIVALLVLTAWVATKWDARKKDKEVGAKLEVIRVDVNSNLHEALDRITALESKLGLSSGQDIPTSQILTHGETAGETSGDA